MMTNDEKLLDIMRDFKQFAPRFLTIRSKSGSKSLFTLNRAQLYAHTRLEDQLIATHKVRALLLKGRQQGMCFSPEMKVLTADFKWKKIEEIQIGDKLVACDEFSVGKTKSGKKSTRKFRTAIVEEKKEFYKKTYEILFDNGAILKVTPDHRMLCKKRGSTDQEWRHVYDLKINDEVRCVIRPPNYDCETYEDGWIAGIIDGEGSCRRNGAKRLSIHQVNGPILNKIKDYFIKINMPYKEVIDNRQSGNSSKLGNKPVHRIDIHRMPYLMELFARCRPIRFTNEEWHIGQELPGKSAQEGVKSWAKVISIKPLEDQRVIDIQTSEKTFICEGLVSHNSTLIQARFFHKIITRKGKKAFILTHESEATKNLFGMTKRYYDNLPDGLAPVADSSSVKELHFRSFDSGYSVGTAGNKGVGRSQTIQLFHGSEVAFWPHAEDHAKGILQTVSNEAGTEIILESTANGIGNYFHSMWMSAIKGQSEYQAIFVPWFWQDEYRDFTPGFILSEEEDELLELYQNNGLTIAHLAWRRLKINEFSQDFEEGNLQFKQEYPFTAEEAFLNPIDEPFIHSRHVVRARKNNVEPSAGLILGVDPARKDKDRTAIIRRNGRKAHKLETLRNHNTMEVAGYVKRIIDTEKPIKVYVDCIGIGAGVVDRLREMGYDMVEGIEVSRSANQKKRFLNLRAELFSELKDWLIQDMPVELPDSEDLQSDLCCFGSKYTSNGLLKIESKDDLKARGLPSPDTADALMLTFAGGFYESANAHIETIRDSHKHGMFT